MDERNVLEKRVGVINWKRRAFLEKKWGISWKMCDGKCVTEFVEIYLRKT